MSIAVITRESGKDFYVTLGPLFGSREMQKTLGYPMFDDPGKAWIVIENDGEVKGFCFAWPKTTGTEVGSIYAPSKLIAEQLLKQARKAFPGRLWLETGNDDVIAVARKMKFKGKQSKNITHLEHTK